MTKILVEIPDNWYEQLQNDIAMARKFYTSENYEKLILEGTPLPKGHGELIDRDKTEYLKSLHDAKYGHISWSEAIKRIKYSAPTIIEADKERQ